MYFYIYVFLIGIQQCYCGILDGKVHDSKTFAQYNLKYESFSMEKVEINRSLFEEKRELSKFNKAIQISKSFGENKITSYFQFEISNLLIIISDFILIFTSVNSVRFKTIILYKSFTLIKLLFACGKEADIFIPQASLNLITVRLIVILCNFI